MALNIENLHGLFLPITTPFTEDMAVDYDALQKNMETYAQSGIHGYLALGSNGENRHLSEVEKKKVLQTIVNHKGEFQIVMAGCMYDSTVLTIEFMKFAQEIGCDYATLLTPSYFRKLMTHEILLDYFCDCAEAVDIPVLLYNAPGFTGISLQPETVQVLAQHPNIAGIKDSAPSGIEQFCAFQSETFAVLAGSINTLYPTMTQDGIPGGIISLANAFPKIALCLFELAQMGESEEGTRLHTVMHSINKGISGMHGVPGVKAAMDLAGLTGGYPRKPLKPLGEEERARMKEMLQKEKFL